jgi:hypothetical protein
MDWNPTAPLALNVTREGLLNVSLPPLRAGDQPSISSTRSRYRLHWNQLFLWQGFEQSVVDYWDAVPPGDKNAVVANNMLLSGAWQNVMNDARLLAEGDIKACIDKCPVEFHSAAANGANGAPAPTDLHSSIHRCGQGAAGWGLAGVPDFVMYHAANPRVTALVEVKNPWLVTPLQIDEVINGYLLSFSC